MYFCKIIFLFCLLIVVSLDRVWSQGDTLILSLDECLRIGTDQSPAVRQARENLRSAYWTKALTYANLRPQVGINANIPGYNRTINQVLQPDGTFRFRTVSQAFSSFNLSFDQQISATGTQISISSGVTHFQSFGDNATTFWQTTPVAINISQPLFRFNNLLWDKKRAPIRYSIAQKRFAEQKAENDQNITQQYFEVFLNQLTLENTIKNTDMNDTIFKVAKGRFSVGNIAENELLQAELALMRATSERQRLELDLKRTSRQLCITLGIRTEYLGVLPVPPLNFLKQDTAMLMAQARSNRSDWENQNLQLFNAELNVKQTRLQYLPNANIIGGFGFNQSAQSLAGAYQNPLDRQTATIGISIPVFSFGRAKADINIAETDLKALQIQIQNAKRQFEQEIWLAYEQLQLTQTQLSIAVKSDTIAQKRYEVAANRYLIGKIDIQNLQIAQDEKDRSRREYISALRDCWLAYYRLRRLTLYDVRENKSLLERVDESY